MADKPAVTIGIDGERKMWELAALETSPCTLACPTRINARGYVSLIADARFGDALALIRERNPFPGVCGRVCPRPCEAACKRALYDDPIAICALKRVVFDIEMKRGINPAWRYPVTRGEKVAVVGAGPAGLSAALELVRLGYPVTVFERGREPGGMMNLIPGFRLPQRVVGREAKIILDSGVDLVTGATFGADVTWRGLRRKGFKALLLATGAWKPVRRWGGAGTAGVIHALDFLGEQRDTQKETETGCRRSKRIVVAGNGMMALDAARTAVRMGYAAVTLLVGRSRGLAPMLQEEVKATIGEGVEIKFLARPVKLLRRGRRLSGVRCVRLTEGSPDGSSRREVFETDDTFTIEADLFIDSFSRATDLEGLGREVELAATASGTALVDPESMAAGGGVFAAGDLVGGPRSIVEAIASGQKAACGIHAYLSGAPVETPCGIPGTALSARRELSLDPVPEKKIRRVPMRLRSPGRRKRDFDEVEIGYGKSAALSEAQRCLRCGPCSECSACVDICEKKDLRFEIEGGTPFTVTAGRDFWSLDPERVSINAEGRQEAARVIRTACSVSTELCIGCGRCEEACGYSAVRVESFPGGRFVARVNEIACKGCGNCVAVCPTGAMDQRNYERARLLEAVAGIDERCSRVVFACRWAAPDRIELPHGVLFLETMCLGRVTPSLVVAAALRGVRGIMLCGCREEDCRYRHGRQQSRMMIERSKGILSLLGRDGGLIAERSCRPAEFNGIVRAWIKGRRGARPGAARAKNGGKGRTKG